jgi:hypothetical protein
MGSHSSYPASFRLAFCGSAFRFFLREHLPASYSKVDYSRTIARPPVHKKIWGRGNDDVFKQASSMFSGLGAKPHGYRAAPLIM